MVENNNSIYNLNRRQPVGRYCGSCCPFVDIKSGVFSKTYICRFYDEALAKVIDSTDGIIVTYAIVRCFECMNDLSVDVKEQSEETVFDMIKNWFLKRKKETQSNLNI